MKYKKVDEEILKQLENIVGSDGMLLAKEAITDYAHDESSIDPYYP